MLKFFQHPYGRRLLVCFFSLCFLEIWLYLTVYQNPGKASLVQRLEGWVSLALLLYGFVCGHRYFADEAKVSVVGWWLIACCLALLFFVPFTPLPKNEWTIEVFKSERLLTVKHPDQTDTTYRIGLGGCPLGDKEVMGDSKTPEGRFLIVDKAPSQFHKWMALSYPTPGDAWQGRLEGKITWAELWYIKVETLNGRIPYSTSALGGSVGIHGGGSDNDWTLGCIALSNQDIDAFYQDIPLGTVVIVHP